MTPSQSHLTNHSSPPNAPLPLMPTSLDWLVGQTDRQRVSPLTGSPNGSPHRSVGGPLLIPLLTCCISTAPAPLRSIQVFQNRVSITSSSLNVRNLEIVYRLARSEPVLVDHENVSELINHAFNTTGVLKKRSVRRRQRTSQINHRNFSPVLPTSLQIQLSTSARRIITTATQRLTTIFTPAIRGTSIRWISVATTTPTASSSVRLGLCISTAPGQVPHWIVLYVCGYFSGLCLSVLAAMSSCLDDMVG